MPVSADYSAPLLKSNCADPAASLQSLREQYLLGLDLAAKYFEQAALVFKQWHEQLLPLELQTANVAIGTFQPLVNASTALEQSADKLSKWQSDFNDQLATFSPDFSKCIPNKSKKNQFEAAVAKFTEISDESLSVVSLIFSDAEREALSWGTQWSKNEGQVFFYHEDYFSDVVSMSDSFSEAPALIIDNGKIALSELDGFESK